MVSEGFRKKTTFSNLFLFDFDLSTVHSEGIRIRSVDNLASFRAIALQECGNPQDLSVE